VSNKVNDLPEGEVRFSLVSLCPSQILSFLPSPSFFLQTLPKEFFEDWLRVAVEECEHYTIWSKRLKDKNRFLASFLSLFSFWLLFQISLVYSHYGFLPVHNGLWQSASETKHSLLARFLPNLFLLRLLFSTFSSPS
jgi:hypothetical protein